MSVTAALKKALGPGASVTGAEAVAEAKNDVNVAAERARWAYVPAGHQASVYQEKARQADACQAVIDGAGTPDADDYPYLKAEIGTTIDPATGEPATDVAGVAAAVIQRRDLWVGLIDPAIEGTRLALGKDLEALDVEDGGTPAAARQIAMDARDTIAAAIATALGA